MEPRLTLPGRGRLDKELSEALGISREASKRMIRAGRVRIGDKTRHHPAQRLGRKTDIVILPPAQNHDSTSHPAGSPLTQTPDIDVLFEDDILLAVNKPSGVPVHPGAGHRDGTLVDILREKGFRLATLTSSIGPLAVEAGARAGLVHRLDKDTSGVLLLAKDAKAGELLMRQFAERKIEKEYRAVVRGQLPARPLKIVGAIGRDTSDRKKLTVRRGGREATTRVELLAKTRADSYAKIFPETGRTHQIRVHLSHAGFPVLGDSLYGQPAPKTGAYRRMLLHAYRLKFEHPGSKSFLDLTAPLPKDFLAALRALGFPEKYIVSSAP